MEKLRQGGFLISKIKQISGRIFDRKLKEYDINDLNTAQGRIIFSLWQKNNVNISDLARHTALGKTTLTSMLDRLEKSGFITISLDKNDKRKSRVALTNKSKSLEGRYDAVSREMTELFYRGFSEKQINDFERNLKQILLNLAKYEDENK